jgi:hypothetical protein
MITLITFITIGSITLLPDGSWPELRHGEDTNRHKYLPVVRGVMKKLWLSQEGFIYERYVSYTVSLQGDGISPQSLFVNCYYLL